MFYFHTCFIAILYVQFCCRQFLRPVTRRYGSSFEQRNTTARRVVCRTRCIGASRRQSPPSGPDRWFPRRHGRAGNGRRSRAATQHRRGGDVPRPRLSHVASHSATRLQSPRLHGQQRLRRGANAALAPRSARTSPSAAAVNSYFLLQRSVYISACRLLF